MDRWLCGGVAVNHHTLSDFRTGHRAWLDATLTRSIASLLDKRLVTLQRIAQDGMRVRASAKAASFRRRPRLERLLAEARTRVATLKQELSGEGLTQRQKAARKRAAIERERRLLEALATMERIETERAPKRKRGLSEEPADPPGSSASAGSAASEASGANPAKPIEAHGKKKPSEARVSPPPPIPQARVMKMADGGRSPRLHHPARRRGRHPTGARGRPCQRQLQVAT